MKKIILSALAALILFSCAITKNDTKSDKSEGKKTTEERTITRPGDTVTINIPNIKFKDTVIQRTSYETNTIARVTYDSEGNQSFDCIPAEIREEFKTIREEFKNDIESDKNSNSELSPENFIYALAILGGILILLVVLLIYGFAKIKSSIPDIIKETVTK